MRKSTRLALLRYGSALAAVLLATAARLLLDPVFGDLFPFATLFFAVLIVAGYAGREPALLATLFGAVASARFLLPPRNSFAVLGVENQAGMVLYVAISLGIAILGGALWDARHRAERDADEAARQRDELRITLLSIGDAVLVTDAEGRVTVLNPVAETLTGWPAADAAGQPLPSVFRIVDEATRREVENPARRALREGVIVGLANHTILIARDGTERPIDDSAGPIRDSSGRVVGAVLVFRDISEKKRAEMEIRLAGEQARTILESITEGFFALSRDWRFTYVNRQAEALLNRTREDLLGKNLWEEYPDILGGDTERNYRRAIDEDVTVTFERFYPPHERWYENHLYPSEDGLSVYFRDISKRKRSEGQRDRLIEQVDAERRYLRTIIESSPDCIKELDLEGRLISISENGLRLLEIANLCDVLNKPWIDFWEGEGREAARTAVAKALAGGVGAFESYCPTARGTPKWWEVVVTPILDAEGKPHRLLSISRDITERRRHQEERERLLAEAQDANLAKTQFLAVLSHELRTPLNPILLATTIILDGPSEPEEIRPTLEMIRQNVNLQARLIDDLLDVMRIVRGKMPLHWEVADCHKLIHQAIQICRSDVFGSEQRLELDLAASHHHVNADSARLQQVLWNLIKNAVKFTPEGGTITIRTRNQAAPGRPEDFIAIEVSDTGIGIEPDVIARVFDPFQQGETTITRKFGGLGLGLAICKGVVDAHGGTIGVESGGKGRGTTFRVVLKALPESSAADNGQPIGGDSEADAGHPASLRILVVEDEPATLRLMARMLRGLGHAVTPAGTITSAYEAFEAGEFDLIVSDIGLPDGTGLELMRRVVALRGQIPAIALTGYGMEDDIVRSRQAGFTTHMTKPIDFTKLEAMIRQVATRFDPTSPPRCP